MTKRWHASRLVWPHPPIFFCDLSPIFCYFSPILLLFFIEKSADFHIWKCTLEANIVTNNEHHSPIFCHFSSILLLFFTYFIAIFHCKKRKFPYLEVHTGAQHCCQQWAPPLSSPMHMPPGYRWHLGQISQIRKFPGLWWHRSQPHWNDDAHSFPDRVDGKRMCVILRHDLLMELLSHPFRLL